MSRLGNKPLLLYGKCLQNASIIFEKNCGLYTMSMTYILYTKYVYISRALKEKICYNGCYVVNFIQVKGEIL